MKDEQAEIAASAARRLLGQSKPETIPNFHARLLKLGFSVEQAKAYEKSFREMSDRFDRERKEVTTGKKVG